MTSTGVAPNASTTSQDDLDALLREIRVSTRKRGVAVSNQCPSNSRLRNSLSRPKGL